MKSHQTRNNRLTLLILVLVLIGLAVSGYTLWSSANNRGLFQSQIREDLRHELAKLNIPTKEDITIDEAKIVLAVAQYCQVNNCRGPQGLSIQGAMGPQGPQGNPGSDGADGKAVNGTNGQDGVDGTNGVNGQDGENGKTPYLRCNTTKNRWEVRYSEDENWVIVPDEDGNPSKCLVAP